MKNLAGRRMPPMRLAMELNQILELLGQEHLPGDEMTGAFLDDAVAGFALNPAGSTNSIKQLQANDPSGFVLAAVRLLTSTKEKSAGVHYVAGLMFAGGLLVGALLDQRILAEDAATALARNLARAEPLLDVRLFQKMLANAGGDSRAVKDEVALWVFSLIGAFSECSRLAPYLVQFLRHPSARVRSEAARLLGRANLNLSRIKSFLASDDVELRVHALKSVWGHQEKEVQNILREASADSNPTVAIHALIGLCRTGAADACDRVRQMNGSSDPCSSCQLPEAGMMSTRAPEGEPVRSGPSLV